MTEEEVYAVAQRLLPFDKKDCFFCKGAKCDACSRTGLLSYIMDEKAYRQGMKTLRERDDQP